MTTAGQPNSNDLAMVLDRSPGLAGRLCMSYRPNINMQAVASVPGR